MPKRKNDKTKWCFILRVIIFVFLSTWLTSWCQAKLQANPVSSQWSCLKRQDILRDKNKHIRWFSSTEMMKSIIDKQSVERPGSLGKNKIRGVAIIQVVVDKTGKVICTRSITGNPIGITAALTSLRTWIFRPYIVDGRPKSIVGTLSIPYDFSQ